MRMPLLLCLILSLLFLVLLKFPPIESGHKVLSEKTQKNYWFLLQRKSNIEKLYYGPSGEIKNSQLIKSFPVKTGIPNKKPTPLPQLLGKKYWIITTKTDSSQNPETAPYFLPLNIPSTDTAPFGPTPYPECDGDCNWEIPGEFGLHGVSGDMSKLAKGDPGSSGCIRHRDEDITFLYNLLDPGKDEIRYYIEDI